MLHQTVDYLPDYKINYICNVVFAGAVLIVGVAVYELGFIDIFSLDAWA